MISLSTNRHTDRARTIKDIKLEHYVVFSLAVILLYTLAEFVAGFFGISHDGLTPYVYGVFGGEVLSCALIKIFKLRENRSNENDTTLHG